jgi:hypothetical protein
VTAHQNRQPAWSTLFQLASSSLEDMLDSGKRYEVACIRFDLAVSLLKVVEDSTTDPEELVKKLDGLAIYAEQYNMLRYASILRDLQNYF